MNLIRDFSNTCSIVSNANHVIIIGLITIKKKNKQLESKMFKKILHNGG